jgi:hypothetical protein
MISPGSPSHIGGTLPNSLLPPRRQKAQRLSHPVPARHEYHQRDARLQRRQHPTPNQGFDKSDPQYVERLQLASLTLGWPHRQCVSAALLASSKGQCPQSAVRRESIAMLKAYVRVNTAINPKMCIPDLYKTGWTAQGLFESRAHRCKGRSSSTRSSGIGFGGRDSVKS